MMLRDLEWLVEVADTGHVTTAAAVLGTSQPTLSRSIARVEAELATTVFTRTAEGVHPTPTGGLVLEAARELTGRYDRLRAELGTVLDPDSGTVRLAFLDSMATSLVPRVLGEFHAVAPAVRVLLSQEPAHEMLADLATGAVDLAITSPRPDGPHAWLPLQEERLVVVLPPGHRYAERRRLRLADLDAALGDELITTPVGFGHRGLVDGLLRAAGVGLPVSFESQDLATIEGLVAAGLGLAILPEQLAGVSGTVGVPVADRGARRTIGLAWRSDRRLPPPAERLRRLLSDASSSAGTRPGRPSGRSARSPSP